MFPPAIEVNPDPLPVITPLVVSVPVTFAPVPVTTSTFALPAELRLILPFAEGIRTLLFPFANVPIKLPAIIFPVTPNDVNVPILVMFGCAAVVNVPEI